jgi:hypothetical protein
MTAAYFADQWQRLIKDKKGNPGSIQSVRDFYLENL